MCDNKIDINDLIQKIDAFPTLPTIYYTLMEVMNNPRSTANDVAAIISQDQASASKILKTANSPIYGFYGRIENITQAISYIGFDEVKNLITALTIFDFFNKKNDAKSINPVDFWKHSIAVGIMSRLIGKAVSAKDLENYFLAGILHDLGKLLFLNLIPEEYSKVLKYSLENRISNQSAEIKILGITHGIAGELLAAKWNLPTSIKFAVRYHNTGFTEKSHQNIVAATHIANIAVTMFGFGYSQEMIISQPEQRAWKILNLPDNFFTSVSKIMVNSFLESSNLLLG